MPESEEKRELGGLARSIDALFAGAPSGSPPLASDADLADVQSLDDVVWGSSVEEESSDTGVLESEPVHEPDDPEAVLEPGDQKPLDTPGEDGSIPEPEYESSGSGPHPDEFAEAVEAFLSGSEGAGERVDALAAGLRERLALDPLADAVERLVRAAGDPPDSAILAQASSVINPAVASRLVQRMGQEHDVDRKADYVALCQRLGRIMANAFRGALTHATDRSARRVYYDTLIAMGETSRPVIEGMVDDDNRFLVRNAVAMLGEIGGDRAVQLVTSALANTDARVRREALISLARLGDRESGQFVVGFLEDPDPAVRLGAAVAAGELGVERAVRPLLELLDGEQDPDVCMTLLRALGQLRDPGAVIAIEKHAVRTLFSKPRTDVRIAAYRALHRIGTPHARKVLGEALGDKEAEVQALAVELLASD